MSVCIYIQIKKHHLEEHGMNLLSSPACLLWMSTVILKVAGCLSFLRLIWIKTSFAIGFSIYSSSVFLTYLQAPLVGCHCFCLWLIVRGIPVLVFKELLTRLSEEKRNGAPHLPKIGDIKKASRYSIPDLAVDVEQVIGLEKVNKKSKANTVGGRNKLKKILDKTRISILPQKPYKYVKLFSAPCFSAFHRRMYRSGLV